MREGERKTGFDGSIEMWIETLNDDNEKNKINRWKKGCGKEYFALFSLHMKTNRYLYDIFMERWLFSDDWKGQGEKTEDTVKRREKCKRLR